MTKFVSGNAYMFFKIRIVPPAAGAGRAGRHGGRFLRMRMVVQVTGERSHFIDRQCSGPVLVTSLVASQAGSASFPTLFGATKVAARYLEL